MVMAGVLAGSSHEQTGAKHVAAGIAGRSRPECKRIADAIFENHLTYFQARD
jgi:hypothetical protein